MTETELRALVAAFETGALPLSEWHTREHLLVALHYLRQHPRERALELLCAGIQRYNASQGIAQTTTGGYHETLTRALGLAVARLLASRGEASLGEQAAVVLDALSDWRAAVRVHYSRERLNSWEARTSWVEPDLEPLP